VAAAIVFGSASETPNPPSAQTGPALPRPALVCPGWVGLLSKPVSYDDWFVARETMNGEPVTEQQIQAWADEAERGYSVERLRRGGRPAVGDGPGEVIAVRMDDTLLAALAARATHDHVSRSEAIRAAVRAWIDAA
jgi:hypothetical protein